MSLPSQAAPLRGSNYHFAIGWLWACQMLCDPARFLTVSVEDAAGGAFDDVVVRRRVDRDLYLQSKSSNYGDVVVDSEWLLTSTSAEGSSPLQRFYGTFGGLVAAGGAFSLELWTNRGFDHEDPLLGSLLDGRHHRINTQQMLGAGPRSRVGRQRDSWAQHLGVSVEALAAFLDAVRWKHSGSELDIRFQARPWMRLAGLRSDDSAVALGLDIVREWVLDGLGPQNAEDVGRQTAAMGLVRPSVETSSAVAGEEILEGLPPPCRVHVESLMAIDSETAGRVSQLLRQRGSRTPGVLAHLGDDPPEWLQDADGLAWEALAGFMSAHGLSGFESLLHRAMALGSLSSDLYRVQEAVSAAVEGNRGRAEELLAHVSSEFVLVDAARARINDDAAAVVAALRESSAHESTDSSVALEGVSLLVWGHSEMDQVELAISALDDASRRFPDRGSLYLRRALLKLELARRLASEGTDRHDLLEAASELALEARDRFRAWQGPSAQAVDVAAQALLQLNQPQRAHDLTAVAPAGEATVEEAEDASVVNRLAQSLLSLDRPEEVERLDLDLLDGSEGTLIRAFVARNRGDADAVALMREAVEQADDDRTRLMALHGLASFGEVDESALGRVSTARAAEVVLVRAAAAFYREDDETVVRLLSPHRRESYIHAEYLARAQYRSGAAAEAIETLRDAAEARGATFLYAMAVEMLMEQESLDDAESLALTVLAGPLPASVESRLRHSLVEIARLLRDWARMEAYGRSLLARFPDAPLAPWGVVYSLIVQAEHRSAWGFIVEHSLQPIDEDTALLAIQAFMAADPPGADVERMLEIASRFAHSEEVAGAALMALMARGEGSPPTEAERSRYAAMLSDYFERFPESPVLRQFSFEGPKEALEMIESLTGPPSLESAQTVNLVRNGQMPYGVLRAVRALPYAELLLSLAAGHLTAISTNEDQRDQERSAVRAALGKDVSVDASVVALAIHGEVAVDELASVFKRVLVADELVADARAATLSASTPVAAHAIHDPVLGGVRLAEEGDRRDQLRDSLARLQQILRGWRSVPSGRVTAPWSGQGEDWRTWDASLRVALDRGCALWCDDIALRAWARSEGVPTFGTYALCEVLATDPNIDLPLRLDDLKARLLSAGIADVPLTWPELSDIANADDDTDLPAIQFLSRPLSWGHLPNTLRWYRERFTMIANGPDKYRVLGILRAATYGSGMSVELPLRRTVTACILAEAVGTLRDPELTPALVIASRYACQDVDPSGNLDVLGDAAESLWQACRTDMSPAEAAQAVLELFAQCDDADRTIVTTAILVAND